MPPLFARAAGLVAIGSNRRCVARIQGDQQAYAALIPISKISLDRGVHENGQSVHSYASLALYVIKW